MNKKETKVLILDDQRHCQDVAKRIIEENGFCAVAPDVRNICKAAENRDLCDFVCSLIEEHHPQILLTDIQYLNDETYGFDIASCVSGKYPEIKVIGMTSSAFSYDEKVKESDMFTLLNKDENRFAEGLINALNNCT